MLPLLKQKADPFLDQLFLLPSEIYLLHSFGTPNEILADPPSLLAENSCTELEKTIKRTETAVNATPFSAHKSLVVSTC